MWCHIFNRGQGVTRLKQKLPNLFMQSCNITIFKISIHDTQMANCSIMIQQIVCTIVSTFHQHDANKVLRECHKHLPVWIYLIPIRETIAGWQLDAQVSMCLLLWSVYSINSLWSSDVIWHTTGSILAQIMTFYLTVLSHYLNQSWIITS